MAGRQFFLVNIFYYHKRGEGGVQKVMIGIIISDNYGPPLAYNNCADATNLVYTLHVSPLFTMLY